MIYWTLHPSGRQAMTSHISLDSLVTGHASSGEVDEVVINASGEAGRAEGQVAPHRHSPALQALHQQPDQPARRLDQPPDQASGRQNLLHLKSDTQGSGLADNPQAVRSGRKNSRHIRAEEG
ncbi:hypothetical protein ACK3TF_006180 [Chlorella vulgaris]